MDETLINSSQNHQNNSALNNLSCGPNNIADSATYSNSSTSNNTNTSFNKSNSTHSKISLRPYQQEALLALDKSHKQDKTRLLISLPTGAGKTIIFANLIANRSLNNNSRSLVIAHRDELIEQAVDKIQLVIDGADIGIVKANNNQINSRVVVASIQTLARESRLAQLEKNFSTIIVDEAHHASANSYLRVLQSLGSFNQNNAPLTVGVTATPERGDKIGLDKVFQEIVYHRSLIEMINQQYLSDLTWQEISLDLDLDKVETRGGDFIESKLIEALAKTDAPRQVLTAFKQYASDRKSLIFVPGVTLARTIATLFQEHNIACESIDGTLPTDERKSILSRLKSGQTQVVVNCMVLTEGFDESSIDCIIFARPTKSKSFYLQMLGRGTRLHPGKKDCLVIDLVGLSYQHNLVSLPNLFGLSGDKLKTKSLLVANQEAEDELKAHQEKQALNLIAELEKAKANAQNKDVQDADNEVIKPRISNQKLVDYVKEDKKKPINFNWLKLSNDCYALSISNGIIFLIKSEGNLWSAIYRETNKNITLIGQNLPLEYAQGVAQDFIRNLSSLPLVDLNASWRNQEASLSQVDLLYELGIVDFDGPITKGQASDLIATHYAKQSLIDYQNELAQKRLVNTNNAAINNTNTNIASANISNFNTLVNNRNNQVNQVNQVEQVEQVEQLETKAYIPSFTKYCFPQLTNKFANYEYFSLDSYVVNSATKDSYNSQEEAIIAIKTYLANYLYEQTGIVLSGTSCTGKTHLAVALLKELTSYYGAYTLFCDFQLLKQMFLANDHQLIILQLMSAVDKADIIVLDDFAVKKITKSVRSLMSHLINYCYKREKKLIITTRHLTYPITSSQDPFLQLSLGDILGVDTVSKLYELCRFIEIKPANNANNVILANRYCPDFVPISYIASQLAQDIINDLDNGLKHLEKKAV